MTLRCSSYPCPETLCVHRFQDAMSNHSLRKVNNIALHIFLQVGSMEIGGSDSFQVERFQGTLENGRPLPLSSGLASAAALGDKTNREHSTGKQFTDFQDGLLWKLNGDTDPGSQITLADLSRWRRRRFHIVRTEDLISFATIYDA